MKKKITTIDKLKEFLGKQDWEVKNLTNSPFPEISLPPTFEFIVGSASFSQISNHSGASIVVGGMDIFRRDLKDYPNLINADHYSIYSTGDKSLFEIVQGKPDYHWVKSLSEIPQDILNSLPSPTKRNLNNLLTEFPDVIGLSIKKK